MNFCKVKRVSCLLKVCNPKNLNLITIIINHVWKFWRNSFIFISRILLSFNFYKLRLKLGDRHAVLVLIIIFRPIAALDFHVFKRLTVVDGLHDVSRPRIKLNGFNSATVERNNCFEVSGIVFGVWTFMIKIIKVKEKCQEIKLNYLNVGSFNDKMCYRNRHKSVIKIRNFLGSLQLF